MNISKSFKEIEQALRECGDDTLTIPQIQGMFTAIACGPRLVPPNEWLPVIFTEPGKVSREMPEERLQQIMDFCQFLYRVTEESLNQGDFIPLLEQSGEGDQTLLHPKSWCEGFAEGMCFEEDLWFDCPDPEFKNLLAPIIYLAYQEQFSGNKGEEATADDPDLDLRLSGALPKIVPQIKKYWNKNSPFPPRSTAPAGG